MPALEVCETRRRFAAARVARLATVAAGGVPHLVPVVFAVCGDTVVTAVDHKPKRSRRLRRLTDIGANPAVCLLVDEYDDARWERLWWARADGTARVAGLASPPGGGTPDASPAGDDEAARAGAALDALVAKYAQYRERRPEGPLVLIAVTRWLGWHAGEG